MTDKVESAYETNFHSTENKTKMGKSYKNTRGFWSEGRSTWRIYVKKPDTSKLEQKHEVQQDAIRVPTLKAVQIVKENKKVKSTQELTKYP